MMKCFLVCALFIAASHSFLWGDNGFNPNVIPSKRETANKIAKNLLGRPNGIYGPRGKGSHSDVAYIIDDSGSINKTDFRKGLEALRLLIDKHQSGDRYGAVKFSTTAQALFNSKFVSSSRAKQYLMNVPYTGGSTNTQAGLKLARTNLFLSGNSGLRPGSRRVAVVITDGRSNINQANTIPQANMLKGIGVDVFVIAVGNFHSGINEIKKIASSETTNLFRVVDMGAFVDVIKLIP